VDTEAVSVSPPSQLSAPLSKGQRLPAPVWPESGKLTQPQWYSIGKLEILKNLSELCWDDRPPLTYTARLVHRGQYELLV
jgi:hypothetical protein